MTHWVVPNTLFTHIFQLSSCVRAQEIHKLVIRQFNLAVLAYLGGVKNLNVEIGAGGPCSGVPNWAMRVAKQERWRRVGKEELNRGSPRTFPLDHSEPLGLTPNQGSSWTPQVLSPPASRPHPCWVLAGDGQERPQ